MNYINKLKKRLVGRNNQQLTNQIIIDYSTIEDISFQIINDQNQIQEITEPSGLYIAGSIGIGKQSYELLFLSKDYTITSGNIITFSIDTYTTNYLNYIKKKNTEINIEIGQESLNTKTVILRDYALACPRVYVSGLSPQEIDSKNYYTKTEVDELISESLVQVDWNEDDETALDYIKNKPSIPSKTSELQNDSGFISGYTETDPIYTADKPSLALKTDLFSGSYNDLTDKPTIPSKTSDLTNDSGFISGYTETDPIYTAEKSTLALKSEIPTKVSELDNDSGFISGYTETDPIYSAQSGQFQLKSEAFDGDYNSLTNKPSIPSKTSELQNDSGFISGYTETDPIYSAEKSTLALKSEIPLSTSQLTNDSGFISGYTETDPVFTAISGDFELKADAFSGSYDDLTDVPSAITLQGNTFNEAGKLVQLDEDGKIPSSLYDAGGGGGGDSSSSYDDPLTFTASVDGASITLVKSGSPSEITCFYNKNDTGWTPYTIETSIALSKGEFVRFKCTTNTFSNSASDLYRFTTTYLKYLYVSGDVTSLINYQPLSNYCFSSLFSGAHILTPPKLPSMIMADYCYNGMFYNCTYLKKFPELPATTLAPYCYQNMFNGCSAMKPGLKTIILPATVAKDSCYKQMFMRAQLFTDIRIYLRDSVNSATMEEMFSQTLYINKIDYVYLSESDSFSDWLSSSCDPTIVMNGAKGSLTRGASRIPNLSPVITQWSFGADNYIYPKSYEGLVLLKKTLSSSNYLYPSNTYAWYVSVSSGSFTLNSIGEPATFICYADLIVDLSADTSVTQGTNTVIVDALTAEKRNICKVKWINGTAYIYVEKVMDK